MKLLIALTLWSACAFAHKGEKHEGPPKPDASQTALKAINAAYVAEVKAIFRKSCFDCHSSQTRFPWYANLPGAKQLIEHDIQEAREHLDMTDDFPFASHATPAEDLDEIHEVVTDGSMPPFRYRILHGDSKLSEADKKTVLNWVDAAKRVLDAKP